jgi:hypothetical protein
MKRDMQELVEVEIAEKEQQFEKIEEDFAKTRELLKDNKGALLEITKERNKRIDQINVEKKKLTVMKNDYNF